MTELLSLKVYPFTLKCLFWFIAVIKSKVHHLALLHSEGPKLHRVLADLSAIGLIGLMKCTIYNTQFLVFRSCFSSLTAKCVFYCDSQQPVSYIYRAPG